MSCEIQSTDMGHHKHYGARKLKNQQSQTGKDHEGLSVFTTEVRGLRVPEDVRGLMQTISWIPQSFLLQTAQKVATTFYSVHSKTALQEL